MLVLQIKIYFEGVGQQHTQYIEMLAMSMEAAQKNREEGGKEEGVSKGYDDTTRV